MKELRGAVATAGPSVDKFAQIGVQGSVVTNGLLITSHHYQSHPSGPNNGTSILIVSQNWYAKIDMWICGPPAAPTPLRHRGSGVSPLIAMVSQYLEDLTKPTVSRRWVVGG